MHCGSHDILRQSVQHFDAAPSTAGVKGGQRHPFLLLMAMLVAAEARVLTEASVLPALAPQGTSKALQSDKGCSATSSQHHTYSGSSAGQCDALDGAVVRPRRAQCDGSESYGKYSQQAQTGRKGFGPIQPVTLAAHRVSRIDGISSSMDKSGGHLDTLCREPARAPAGLLCCSSSASEQILYRIEDFT